MTPEDILRMAREAGLPFYDSALSDQSPVERFAALVAAIEREACAKVCNDYIGCEQVARDIRARGKNHE